MNNYIEYKYRGKCNNCGDIMWTPDNNQGVVCKCSFSEIQNGILSNCIEMTDAEMITYIENDGIDNPTLIKL